MNANEQPDRISGTAISSLPEGMTQQEADRLILEAANQTPNTTKG
jgi:hypothetical protein